MLWLLQPIFDLLQAFSGKIMDWANKAFGPLITIVFAVQKIFLWMGEQMEIVEAKINEGHAIFDVLRDATSSWIYNILPGGMADAFAFVNYALPITELLAFSALLISLFIVAVVVRFIKGLIPTMN